MSWEQRKNLVSPRCKLPASAPTGRGSLERVHLSFSPSALGASTYFPGDICFHRNEHCTGGGDHRCAMSASFFTPIASYYGGGTLKHNEHPQTSTQASHAALLLRPLERGNLLFLNIRSNQRARNSTRSEEGKPQTRALPGHVVQRLRV